MSDQPDSDRYADVRLALDHAHRAARDLQGGELRRALTEARELLQGMSTAGNTSELAQTAHDRIARALADLDNGPLDEAETLIEQVRQDLAAANPP